MLTIQKASYSSIRLQSGSVAQSVEQWPFKPLVPGSSPGRPTIVFHQSKFARRLNVMFFFKKTGALVQIQISQEVNFCLIT